MKFWLAILAATYCTPALPQAAHGAKTTAAIFGRVVNGSNRAAIRRAFVKVYTSKDQWDEVTDGDGRFRFPMLARGDYTLVAHRDGYSDQAYHVEPSDFDAQQELLVELHPQALITGKVLDTFGQPLERASIEALGSRRCAGGTEVIGTAETNDLGEYRLSGLDPGTYRLRATYRDVGGELYPMPATIATAYYGGSEKPAEIALKAGSVTAGIDFILHPVRPATVRGTLHTETGVLAEPATMWIMGKTGEGGHNGNGRDGKFEIADVGPGSYTISAETLDESEPMFGITSVEVRGDDVNAVDVMLRPMPRIEGEIRVEGAAPAALKLGPMFFIRSDQVSMMHMRMGKPDSNRRFTVALPPGEYLLSFDDSIINQSVTSVTLDGQPITDWKLHIAESPGTRKLIIVLGSRPLP